MTKFIVSLFIKNKDDILNPDVRRKYGFLSGTVGIVCNVLLCTVKLIVGLAAGSVSVMADAFNNLSDAASSVVTLIGFRLAGKPADKEHPYGHGRYEYIAALIISAVILIMGFELLKTSADKIIHPQAAEPSFAVCAVLVTSICVKLWLCRFNKKIGTRLNAKAMLAAAADSLSDCVATLAVLGALIAGSLFNINIDGYAGALVALFVIYSGFESARDTIEPLLGQAPDPVFVKNIQTYVLSCEGIIGVHDIIVHDYGPGRIFVSLHAEVNSNTELLPAHEIIDNAEHEIKKLFNCEICIHIDPIALHDESTNRLKALVKNITSGIDERIGIHDFRITTGPIRTNLIFDVVVPYGFKMSDSEIVKYISNELKKVDNSFFAVINVDKAVL